MSAPDDAASLAADLAALPPGQRRDVLRALKPFERARVESLLREARTAPAGPASGESGEPDCSPWLARRLSEARQGGDTGALTPAARELLLKAAADAAAADPDGDRPRPPQRSLATAVLGRLDPRRRTR